MTKAKDRKSYFIHASSHVEAGAKIGRGTKIWYFCHIREGARIGKNCNIGQNVFIDKNVSIGNGVKIQNNVSVYTGVTIEDDVFCGPSCVFTNVTNPRAFIERKDEFRPTLVKKGATIGANATIVCGVTIGRYAFVGAGSVVTKDTPDYALVVGVPGAQKGWACSCGVPLKKRNGVALKCPRCHSVYKIAEENLVPIQKTP